MNGPAEARHERLLWTGSCLAHPRPVPLDEYGRCPSCAQPFTECCGAAMGGECQAWCVNAPDDAFPFTSGGQS